MIAAGIAIPLDAMPEAFQRVVTFIPTAPLREVILAAWLGIDADGQPLTRPDAGRGSAGAFGLLLIWTVVGIAVLSSRPKWEPRS